MSNHRRWKQMNSQLNDEWNSRLDESGQLTAAVGPDALLHSSLPTFIIRHTKYPIRSANICLFCVWSTKVILISLKQKCECFKRKVSNYYQSWHSWRLSTTHGGAVVSLVHSCSWWASFNNSVALLWITVHANMDVSIIHWRGGLKQPTMPEVRRYGERDGKEVKDQ